MGALLIAAAQATPNFAVAEGGAIDEVLVTATRRPVSESEISAAVSVIGADEIRTHSLLTDALASGLGTYVQQTTPGQGAVIVRGLKGSAVLHMVDGMRLNNAIFRDAPTQYLALVPAIAVDRIEVVRGTQSSLYGSDAVGGVVQIVTRRPRIETQEFGTNGEFSASFNSGELAKSIGARIDAGTKQLATSVSVEHINTGNRYTGSGERIGPSGYESNAARIAVAVTPTDVDSWLFDLQWLNQPATPRIDELIPGFLQTQPSSSEFLFAPNERIFAHTNYTRSDGFLDANWSIDMGWQRIVDDRIARDFESPLRSSESNQSDLYGITMSAFGTSSMYSWIVGAEYYYDVVSSTRSEENIVTGEIQSLSPRFPDKSNIRQAAVYGRIDWQIATRHTLGIGLRYSGLDIRVKDTPSTDATSVDASDPSGEIGYIFSASEAWQVLANLGRGFRAPNIFDLGTLGNRPGNRFNIPTASLQSERVVHSDIGVRYGAESLKFEVFLYELRYDDRITSVFTGEVTPEGRDIVQSANVSRSQIHGVEAGFSIDLTERLTLNAILNYAKGSQKVAGATNEPADRIPPLNGALKMTFDSGSNWHIQGWVKFADDQRRLSARDVRDPRIDPSGTDGWGVVGAELRIDTRNHWHVSFAAQNLFDSEYRTHGSGLDSPGRSLSLRVRRTWK